MNVVVKVLVCGILLGSVSSAFADEFEEFLEASGSSPSVLQCYQERKQAFEAEGDALSKDRIAKKIFTQIANWKFAEEWELAEVTALFLRQVTCPLFPLGYEFNQEQIQEIQQHHARLVDGHRLRAEQALQGIETADERLKYWFAKRQASQPGESEKEVYKVAYKEWVKAQCARVCSNIFRTSFWEDDWYNPSWLGKEFPYHVLCRIPLDDFQVELSQFLGVRDEQPFVHLHISKELNLRKRVASQNGFVTYQILDSMRQQALKKYNILWINRETVGH